MILAGGLLLGGVGLLLVSRSWDAFLSYLVTVSAVLATIGTLEVVGYSGLISWAEVFAPRVSAIGTEPAPYIDVRGTTRQDTASLWGLPNEPIGFHYRTDRHGFRNQVDRPIADIFLLGDSIVVGALVSSDNTIGALLEKETGKSVKQIALSGLSPQAEHKLFWDLNVDVRGKVVVQVIFEGNDLLDSYAFRRSASGTRQKRNGSFLIDQVWRMAASLTDSQRGVSGLRVCTIGDQLFTFLWAQQSFKGHEDEASFITSALDEFAARVRGNGGQFGIVFVPKKLRVLGPLCHFPEAGEIKDYKAHLGGFREHLRQWSNSRGLDYVDLTEPLMAAARAGEIPWFWGDSHLNEAGHQTIARTLRAWPLLGRQDGAAR